MGLLQFKIRLRVNNLELVLIKNDSEMHFK